MLILIPYLQNCLLIYDYINNKLPKSFNNTFIKLKDVHTFSTRNANTGNLHPYSNTTIWKNLSGLSRDKLKKLITEQFFNSYLITVSYVLKL